MTRNGAGAPDEELDPLLDAQTCLELLDRSGSASLACTTRALPSVLPVTVRVTSSQIRLVVDRAVDPDRLRGQIVAVGAGFPATPRAAGWWVVVRGEIRRERGSTRELVLEPSEIEGRALPTDTWRRWTWR
jgi:hypothetical protein